MKLLNIFVMSFILISCAEDKRSPDYSDRSPSPNKKEQSPQSKSEKDLSSLPINSFSEICQHYPDILNIVDWQAYLNDLNPLTKIPSLEDKVIETYSRKGSWETLLAKDLVIESLKTKKQYFLKESYQAKEQGNCKYPSLEVYQNNQGEILYWVKEWRTDGFYQAEHFVLPNETVLIRARSNGEIYAPQPLFKERLSFEKKNLFLRAMLGEYRLELTELDVFIRNIVDLFSLEIEGYRPMPMPKDAKIIITNRMATFFGGFYLRFEQEPKGFWPHHSSLDLYRWTNRAGDTIYQIAWGGEPPEFKYDKTGENSVKASGDFDKSRARVYMYIKNPNLNEKVPFVLEYYDLIRDQRAVFKGHREKRMEFLKDQDWM